MKLTHLITDGEEKELQNQLKKVKELRGLKNRENEHLLEDENENTE